MRCQHACCCSVTMLAVFQAPQLPTTAVLLLCLQIVFALIAFAAAASLYNGGVESYKVPKVQFMVFTGVMAFLLAIFYAIVSCVEGLKRTFSGVLEVMVNGLWCIFWLAAAASFAAYPDCKYVEADLRQVTRCDVFLASQAFAWLSWFLWIGSLLIAVIEMRRGEGLTGGKKKPCLLQKLRIQAASAAWVHTMLHIVLSPLVALLHAGMLLACSPANPGVILY